MDEAKDNRASECLHKRADCRRASEESRKMKSVKTKKGSKEKPAVGIFFGDC